MNGGILNAHRSMFVKKKRKIIFLIIALIVIALVFLGYIVFVHAQERCKDNIWPIPPPSSLDFGSYYLMTDQGPLYIGQTYEHKYEGPWVGNMTLLFIDKNGAVLLFRYPERSEGFFEIHSCKGFLLRPVDIGNGE
jgi:hypothetical protein